MLQVKVTLQSEEEADEDEETGYKKIRERRTVAKQKVDSGCVRIER